MIEVQERTPTVNKPAPPVAAVVVGASAGGIEALSAILPALPHGCAFPVMVVVHLPPDRESLLVELFRAKCRARVKEAEDKEEIEAGTIYFAPPNYHLLVEPHGRLSLSCDEQVLFSRPSIDVLFETAADAYGSRLIGVVLSGANSDGARGLRAVCDAGGKGFVQQPETATASAMPQAALAACPEARALHLDLIARELVEASAAQT